MSIKKLFFTLAAIGILAFAGFSLAGCNEITSNSKVSYEGTLLSVDKTGGKVVIQLDDGQEISAILDNVYKDNKRVPVVVPSVGTKCIFDCFVERIIENDVEKFTVFCYGIQAKPIS